MARTNCAMGFDEEKICLGNDESENLVKAMNDAMTAIGIRDRTIIDAICEAVNDRIEKIRKRQTSKPNVHNIVLQVMSAIKKVADERSRSDAVDLRLGQPVLPPPKRKGSFFRALAERVSYRKVHPEPEGAAVPEDNPEVPLKDIEPPSDVGIDIFLRFRDPAFLSDQRYYDYLSFKRSDTNLALVAAVFVLGGLLFCSRLYYEGDPSEYKESPASISLAAIVLSAGCIISFSAIFFIRLASLSFEYRITWMQRYHTWAIGVLKSRRYGQLAEDGLALSLALTGGMYLLSRALQAPCPAGVSTWQNQFCNPVAGKWTFTPEDILIPMVCLQLSQIIARGASKGGLLLSWLVSVIFVNISMGLVGYEGGFLWINIVLLLKAFLSYELERVTLRHFIKSVQVMETMEANSQLQLKVADYKVQVNERSLEAKRVLVRHIGHEIRTPLNIVCVGTDVLIKELRAMNADGRVPEAILEVIEGIEGASSTALEVVNDLLMFEKIAAGMNTLECVPVALVPFVRKAMKSHALSATAKEVTLELVLDVTDESTLAVNVDPVKMTTVLRNLFSNAIKFSPTGGRVTVKLATEGDCVLISVQDEGAGLSAENLKRLFQEGVQFNANKLQKGGGSGLGLFVTKGIVTQHDGGKIWAESEGEGKGCTFILQLPLHTTAASHEIHIMHTPSGASSKVATVEIDAGLHQSVIQHLSASEHPLPTLSVSGNSKSLVVLLVDDSMTNRKMLARLLSAEGHRCLHAGDGLEALGVISRALLRNDEAPTTATAVAVAMGGVNVANANKVDIVLMDNNMPRMCGPEAAREMRKMGFEGPIIGITGDNDTADFLGAGASKVLLKPVKNDELMEIIASARGIADE